MHRVLVTGGVGYVGSHTCLELASQGHDLLILDNFENCNARTLKHMESILGKPLNFLEADILDSAFISDVASEFSPEVVIHFAGLKAVGESVSNPLRYYSNNLSGSISLLKAMDKVGCRKIVFSSSATVYGKPTHLPIDESHPISPTNPYGFTKAFIEQMISDWQYVDNSRGAVFLRYFNPIGAHPSGKIGEDPIRPPQNIFPIISGVASGRFNSVPVYGTDYPTRDGTGERDYLHVMDLAMAHCKALEAVVTLSGVETFNLGTGKGTTVSELINLFQSESNVTIPVKIEPRREGDVAKCYADPSKAEKELNWSPKFSLKEACKDQLNWEAFRSLEVNNEAAK